MRLLLPLLAFCKALTYAQLPISFPPLLGPHKVGTTTLYLQARANGASPPRDIMVSLFYPTFPSVNTTTYSLAPAYDPGYASYLEGLSSLPAGAILGTPSQAYLDAPLYNTNSGNKHAKDNKCPENHPNIVLFSPGYRNSRLDYIATLSNLASRGYIIIGVDHPNDTAYITYPNTTLITTRSDINDTTAVLVVDLRVKDLRFVLDSLSRKPSAIPGLPSRLDTSRVAIFGHSLGGAAVASSLFSDSRFIAGVNIDGPIFGSVATQGVKSKPFLIIAAQGHDNAINFPAWKSFWKNSKGALELEIQVRGAGHEVFVDLGVFYTILRQLGWLPDIDPTGERFGTIGARIWEVEDAYRE